MLNKFFKMIKRKIWPKKKRRKKTGHGKKSIRRRQPKRPKRKGGRLRVGNKVRKKKGRPAVRKPKSSAKKISVKKTKEFLIGEVTHYFPKVRAAVLKLKKPLSIGDPIWIKGAHTNFRQTVGSIQIDRKPLARAAAGKEVGLEVFKDVRAGDQVFLMTGKR